MGIVLARQEGSIALIDVDGVVFHSIGIAEYVPEGRLRIAQRFIAGT